MFSTLPFFVYLIMASVDEMLDKFEAFYADVERYAMDVIFDLEGDLVEAIQKQLWQGKDGYGHSLAPYAWEEYAEFKLTLNPLGVTDLKFHGFFYDAMRLQILSNKSFSIVSDDRKFEDLMAKYGYDTMIVSEDNIVLLRKEKFNPLFIQRLAEYTGVGTA